jgi:hypothetical protein
MRRARVNAIPEKRKKLEPSAIIYVVPFVTRNFAKNEKLSKMASYIGFTNYLM